MASLQQNKQPPSNAKKKNKPKNKTKIVSPAPLTSFAAAAVNNKPLYLQSDKLEFFVPSESIESADTPTRCTMVAIPVTDGKQLRMARLKSCRVYVWNRGPQDLYLEVLQPFGAHVDASKIVAWGPVKGARNKAQTRWTIKANKSGGSFKIDLTDNNFTLPATVKVTENQLEKLCLCLFAFAVTRNAVTFTGTEGAKSSRSLQMKVVLDYWGNDLPQQSAALLKGLYSDMGAVVDYPKAEARDIYKQLGLISLSELVGIETFVVQDEDVTKHLPFGSGKVYSDTQGAWQPTDDVKILAMRAPSAVELVMNLLSATSGEWSFPISPVQGLVWKTDDDRFEDHLLVAGFGDVIVHSSRFPAFQGPVTEGWYVGQQYTNRSGSTNYAPLLFGDTTSKHDVLNTWAKTQGMHSQRTVLLDRLIPYHHGWQAFSPKLDGLFEISTTQRSVVMSSGVLSRSNVNGFSVAAWISMITVIIKVVEAAYNAYTTYKPTNAGSVLELPLHKLHVEEIATSEFVMM